MSGTVVTAMLVMLVVLIVGIPAPFAFFIAAFIIAVGGGYDPVMLMQYGHLDAGTFVLIVIPMLFFAAVVLEKCRIGEALAGLTGLTRGGAKRICMKAVVSCALLGAVSGRGSDVAADMNRSILSGMQAAGYSKGTAASLLSGASMMSMLIPPSITVLLYAYAGGQSLAACFLAAIVPGVILMVLLALVAMFMVRKEQDVRISPDAADTVSEDDAPDLPKSALPAILSPVIILACIFTGVLAVTEAVAAAAIYILLLGWFFYREMDREVLAECLVEAGRRAGVTILMLLTGMILARLMILENVPQAITDGLFSISDSNGFLLLLMVLLFVIMGLLMDENSAILVTAPVIVPVVTMIGINPVQFSVVACLSVGLGCMVFPGTKLLRTSASASDASGKEMVKPLLVFILLAWLPVLLLTMYIPQFSLFLPALLGYV